MCGGAVAGDAGYSGREEKVSDLDDGLPLGAKDGMSRREPEALDAHTELRRERHKALRHGPMVAELRSTGIAVPLSDNTLPLSTTLGAPPGDHKRQRPASTRAPASAGTD